MKTGNSKSAAFFAVLLVCLSNSAAMAQQTIQDKSGSMFMEEVPDKKSSHTSKPAPASQPPAPRQEIHTDDGSLFMEEVPQKKKAKPAAKPPVDLSSLGVPVDPHGKIVPLIQPGGAPPVMQNGSRLDVEYTPPSVYVPYSTTVGPPVGYVPQRTPFGTYAAPVYRTQNGVMNVPIGVPRSYSSSSDNPASQQSNFQFSGSVINGYPGTLFPKTTQFDNQGSVRSIFPPSN